MTKQQQIAIASLAGSFILLYATGILWPVVRLFVTLAAIFALGATCFFGFKSYLSYRRRDPDLKLEDDSLPELIASCILTVFMFALLGLVPTSSTSLEDRPNVTGRNAATASKAVPASQEQPSKERPIENLEQQLTSLTATNADEARAQEIGSKQGARQPSVKLDDDGRAAAEVLGALIGAAADQQQREQNDPRYQRLKQSIEAASRCPRCGGAGYYRFVDAAGVLQSRACPSCLGSGKAF